MRPRPVITRRQALVALFACAALVATLGVRRLRPIGMADSAHEITTLRAEIAALPVARERPAAVPEITAADWQTQLGASWRVSEDGAALQIVAASPGAFSWRELQAAVVLFEAGGASLRSLVIATRGTRHVRQFSRVEFSVARPTQAVGRDATAAPVSPNADRRARGTTDRTAAEDRALPAALHSAVHFAADKDAAASFPAPRARAAGPTLRGSSGWSASHDEPQPRKP